MEPSIALSGQVCGRIESIKPVQIIRETVDEFFVTVRGLSKAYVSCATPRRPDCSIALNPEVAAWSGRRIDERRTGRRQVAKPQRFSGC